MPSLLKGTSLGPYRIVDFIGEGGMGTVYRAQDPRLGRDVAIKVSAIQFNDRFNREARAVAALNHPHICTLHDVGPDYLVMELVDGDTLAERIRGGPLPVKEALRVAIEIADALEAAHEKDIVHRDLKPGNVKLTSTGSVKVLDFGLAKMKEPAPAGETVVVANSPTFAAPTEAGLILGTAAYMSPEQARGKPVDRRTDIWAFGCVLFEMLTGKAAFEGETVTDILAALVTAEPRWNALPPATPPGVRSVLRRCLQKEPARRMRDIADARMEIQEALETPQVMGAPLDRTRGRWASSIPVILAAVLGTSTIWLGVNAARRSAPTLPSPIRLEVNLPDGVETYIGSSPSSLAFAPDGSRLAYVGMLGGQRFVYIRELAESSARAINGTDGTASVFFSPNGRSIGVVLTSGVLRTISLDDGLVTTLARDAQYTAGGTWGNDNRITFGRGDELWAIPAGGGNASRLTTLDKDKGELTHTHPAITADGKTLLFAVMAGSARAGRIEALPLTAGGARRVVMDAASNPIHTTSGHLIFLRNRSVLAVGFDSERLESIGSPVRVIDEVRLNLLGSSMTLGVSRTGSLAFMSGRGGSQLVWVSRQGLEQPITKVERAYANPVLEPLGARRLATTWEGDVWIQDVMRSTDTRLTSDATSGNSFPIWTPDGKRIIFRSITGMYWMDAGGSGRQEAIPGTSILDYPHSVSPDGRWLAFMRLRGDSAGDVFVVALDGQSTPSVVLGTPAYEGGAQFSPDGRWLAFASDESGNFQVFMRPFEGDNRKWLVAQSGRYPRWSGDGRELFYRDGNKMLSVGVSTNKQGPVFTEPRPLFERPYQFGTGLVTANYDVTPDGQRFVMVKDNPAANRIGIVLNWFEELRRLVPARP